MSISRSTLTRAATAIGAIAVVATFYSCRTPAPNLATGDAAQRVYTTGGETHFLVELSRATEWQAKAALVRKATRPELRSYLRRPA